MVDQPTLMILGRPGQRFFSQNLLVFLRFFPFDIFIVLFLMEYLPRNSSCLHDPIEWHPGGTNFDQSVCVYPNDSNPMVGSDSLWCLDRSPCCGWDSPTCVSVIIPSISPSWDFGWSPRDRPRLAKQLANYSGLVNFWLLVLQVRISPCLEPAPLGSITTFVLVTSLTRISSGKCLPQTLLLRRN